MTTHVISATYTRFDRMSPTAAALAVLLHVATALALWWVSPLSHRTIEAADPAIEVTFEPPAPKPSPEPKAEPEAKPSPPSSITNPPAATPKVPPARLGLPPPSPSIADRPQQAAPKLDPTPDIEPEPKPEPQQALAPPAATPPPATLEDSLPPLEAPPPPVTSKEIPKPPPRPAPPRPKAHAAPPQQQRQQLRPSPLTALQQRRTPANPQATAPSATFVNPADQYNQNSIVEKYLWGVARKISQYRYHSSQANEQGTVVLRMVIRRDGHLLGVSVARSSGIVNLDRGLVEAARAAAPYAALPTSLEGPQITFTLPFASVYRRQ